MTALACLRIIIDADRASTGGETLAALVSRVGSAFLETRWPWPRRFGQIAPGAFLLADPRSTTLDASELTSLSDELHLKLFGANGRGNVTLALLEGDQASATHFAALNPADLNRLMAGICVIDGMEGRLSRITPEGGPGRSSPARLAAADENRSGGRSPAVSGPDGRRDGQLPRHLVPAEGHGHRQRPGRAAERNAGAVQHC